MIFFLMILNDLVLKIISKMTFIGAFRVIIYMFDLGFFVNSQIIRDITVLRCGLTLNYVIMRYNYNQ